MTVKEMTVQMTVEGGVVNLGRSRIVCKVNNQFLENVSVGLFGSVEEPWFFDQGVLGIGFNFRGQIILSYALFLSRNNRAFR